jgi:5'-nucleotidase
MLFAGVNHGGNIGTDTIYSGTVGAAMEGSLNGIPSVALSINGLNPRGKETAFDFSPITELAKKLVHYDFTEIGERTTLNVNMPNIPKEEIRGVKVVPLSYRDYREWFVEKRITEKEFIAEYSGMPIPHESDTESDVTEERKGFITITPLHYNWTDTKALEVLKRSF